MFEDIVISVVVGVGCHSVLFDLGQVEHDGVVESDNHVRELGRLDFRGVVDLLRDQFPQQLQLSDRLDPRQERLDQLWLHQLTEECIVVLQDVH